jgi:eukaryotic-like serine/threonine-protein kinase
MRPRTRVGEQLNSNVTVLGSIDPGSEDPVYIVWHRTSWCPMACKVFRTRARAEKEAGILSVMAHPNIVRVLGVEPPGLLLMPFLDGQSVASHIDTSPRGRLPVADSLRVAIHIGAALKHVHASGFLHLDVKPANVIVVRGGVPVLFDFGSARRIGSKRPPEIIGTDPYIAPEECAMERNVGPAADVFSLGVTLFEMITGQLPFGKSSSKRPMPQLESASIKPSSLRSRLPPGLGAAILSCLARDPAARPPLSELLPRLNDCITTGPRMWPAALAPG